MVFLSNATQRVKKTLENAIVRPTKVTVILGSQVEESGLKSLDKLFSKLGASVLSRSSLSESDLDDIFSSQAPDIVALIGEAKEFLDLTKIQDDSNPIILSFAPKGWIVDARDYLKASDALILCESSNRFWITEVSHIVYSFLESLTTPSMLNVDLADVKRIAKGIGLAVTVSNDSTARIISSLPRESLIARSALLHFTCTEDVSLKEVYSISKSIALKKGLAPEESEISTHADAERLIRKVNVKMGIRILDEKKDGRSKVHERRINLTAIFFGLSRSSSYVPATYMYRRYTKVSTLRCFRSTPCQVIQSPLR